MKKELKFSAMLLVTVAFFVFASCQKQEDFDMQLKSASLTSSGATHSEQNTFYGPALPFGKGIIRAFIAEDKEGNPLAVGVNFSARSLENLPAETDSYELSLPPNKGKNFYKQLMVDWNPHGHEPPGIYDLPHFDFHFYIISNEERAQIEFLAPPAFDPAPEAKYIPPGYFQTPGLIPAMGAHWIDALSPEISGGQKFTKTFIWGSYHGEYIFWEPMITLEYLLTNPDVVIPVRQPASYQRPGWYAGAYKISRTSFPEGYTVALTGLTYHAGE